MPDSNIKRNQINANVKTTQVRAFAKSQGKTGEDGRVPLVVQTEAPLETLNLWVDTDDNMQIADIIEQQKVTSNYEAFNVPLTLNGATVNPTVIVGVDPITGIIYGADRPSNNLSMSADGGVTWVTGRGLPPNVNHVQIHKIVRFGANIYLFAISGADTRAGVYYATAPTSTASTITWSARVATMSVSTSANGPNYESLNGKSTAFNAGTAAIMLGDYGDFTPGPVIQRTLDGTNWTTVWSSNTSRHVHGVAEDPFNPGTWYATIGDGSANTNGILRSLDNGTTWTTIVTGTSGNVYQAVQLSFSAKYVYLGADHYGSTAFYFERNNPVIKNLSMGSHVQIAVKDGVAGRVITDLQTTSGSTAITAASLTAADRGRTIVSDNTPMFAALSNDGELNWIATATAGSGTLRKAATATGTVSAKIGGDAYFVGCYMGAVDPATDIFYFASMDTSSIGNTFGLFYITHPGGEPILLASVATRSVPPTNWRPLDEVYVHNGYVFSGSFKFKALNVVES